MATKTFKGARRSIHIYGVSKPVELSITVYGVELWVKGLRMKAYCSWDTIVHRASTPMNVPSYLAGNTLKFLQYQADKATKKEDGL